MPARSYLDQFSWGKNIHPKSVWYPLLGLGLASINLCFLTVDALCTDISSSWSQACLFRSNHTLDLCAKITLSPLSSGNFIKATKKVTKTLVHLDFSFWVSSDFKNTAKAENYYIGALGSLCRSTALKKKNVFKNVFKRRGSSRWFSQCICYTSRRALIRIPTSHKRQHSSSTTC